MMINHWTAWGKLFSDKRMMCLFGKTGKLWAENGHQVLHRPAQALKSVMISDGKWVSHKSPEITLAFPIKNMTKRPEKLNEFGASHFRNSAIQCIYM